MDQSFYEFRRQLTYKSERYGSKLIVADRFYPSSKICNVCGQKNTDLKLSTRKWSCGCGSFHDRDENAALNLAKLASSTVSSTGFKACGDGSSDILA
jgi:putative transposase